MSHFYGVLQGARGEATRCGTKASGLRTVAASWDGAIEVVLTEVDGINYFTVTEKKWHGRGVHRVLAKGVIGQEGS